MLNLLQTTVKKASELVNAEFGIADEAGMVIACSDETKINRVNPFIHDVVNSKNQIDVQNGYTFKKLYVKSRLEYISYIEGSGEEAKKYLALLSMDISNIKLLSDEKSDRAGFIKTILEGNTAGGDIMLRARDFHISASAFRVAYLVKTERQGETHAYELLQGMFPNKLKDFIIVFDEDRIVLVHELKNPEDRNEIEKTARIIVDTLNAELMENTYVSLGSVADSLGGLCRSYQEASIAMAVGRIFESDKSIISYHSLGIGRLIYQLPPSVCRVFLEEVFKEGSFDSLDDETMHTLHSFFENSLNVSLTSRQLYLHRNTLVYRLDKIQKLTGLDLRKFDDAVVFKMAILVKNYVDSITRDPGEGS